MRRWVLLEHKVYSDNFVDIHYDFLIEHEKDCLTWKLSEIPSSNKSVVEINRQPNHRLIWLSRSEYELSGNRGFVKRIDQGTFINISFKEDLQELKLILNGYHLKGLFEIKGKFCRLSKNNKFSFSQ